MSTSVSSLRRGLAAALVVLLGLSTLAACGDAQADSEFGSASSAEYDPVDGVNLDSSIVKVRNLYMLAAEGEAPPRLRVTLVNPTTEDDALVGATVGQPAVSGRLVGGTEGALPVEAGASVLVGSEGSAQIEFPGLPATSGTWVPVTLLFRNGSAVSGSILVLDAVAEFSDGTVPTGRPILRPTPPAEESGEEGAEEGEAAEPAGDEPVLAGES